MKNIMESEGVNHDEPAVLDGSEGTGPPSLCAEDEFTEEEKALLATWDRSNAPSRASDAQFEARLLAVLDDQLAAAESSALSSPEVADLYDELACAHMAADANADGATGEPPEPLLIDMAVPGGAAERLEALYRENLSRPDWRSQVLPPGAETGARWERTPFTVDSDSGGRGARGLAPWWEAVVREGPGDSAPLRRALTAMQGDSRWRAASTTPHVVGGGRPFGAAARQDEAWPPVPRKLVVLIIAANPRKTSSHGLSQECAAIAAELQKVPQCNGLQFESRWALNLRELTGHLAELGPTVLHVAGHGAARDGGGWVLQDAQGYARPVPTHALTRMIDTAARGLRLTVLNGCFRHKQAEALRRRVDCVVGVNGALDAEARQLFACELYGALGGGESIGHAFEMGIAALTAARRPNEVQPHCLPHKGVDVRTRGLWDPELAATEPPPR
jgi:hypothetical protein